jgi:hypothetical protein
VDLFLRGNFTIGQLRQFSLTEKVMITSKRFQNNQTSLIKSSPNLTESLQLTNKNWVLVNQIKDEKSLRLKSKKLVIYPYSLSNNLLKEVLLKMEFKFVLTNEIRKANLIIGLKKHLKQNFKLISLAKQKNIPIYSLNQVSFYQVSKLIQFLYS